MRGGRELCIRTQSEQGCSRRSGGATFAPTKSSQGIRGRPLGHDELCRFPDNEKIIISHPYTDKVRFPPCYRGREMVLSETHRRFQAVLVFRYGGQESKVAHVHRFGGSHPCTWSTVGMGRITESGYGLAQCGRPCRLRLDFAHIYHKRDRALKR